MGVFLTARQGSSFRNRELSLPCWPGDLNRATLRRAIAVVELASNLIPNALTFQVSGGRELPRLVADQLAGGGAKACATEPGINLDRILDIDPHDPPRLTSLQRLILQEVLP